MKKLNRIRSYNKRLLSFSRKMRYSCCHLWSLKAWIQCRGLILWLKIWNMKRILNRIQNQLPWWSKRKWESIWSTQLRFGLRTPRSMGFLHLWEWVPALILILLITTYLCLKTWHLIFKTKMIFFQKKTLSSMSFATQNWRQMNRSTCHYISWER